MFELSVTTLIYAPAAICFDLARNVDVHLQSAAATGERAVAGKTSGLLELGDEVTWEGRHFGITQRLASRITAFERPRFFQDRMTRGAFRFLEHDHRFHARDGATQMTDILRFQAPLGPLGWIAERLVVGPHLRRFLTARGKSLKTLAEEDVGRPG